MRYTLIGTGAALISTLGGATLWLTPAFIIIGYGIDRAKKGRR